MAPKVPSSTAKPIDNASTPGPKDASNSGSTTNAVTPGVKDTNGCGIPNSATFPPKGKDRY